jgi:hypothetical protein
MLSTSGAALSGILLVRPGDGYQSRHPRTDLRCRYKGFPANLLRLASIRFLQERLLCYLPIR